MLALLLALSLAHGHGHRRAREACGEERWPVKVLTDPDAASVDRSPVARTVEDLVALQPPRRRGESRAEVERTTFEVVATVTGFKGEADGDFHVVIEGESGATMIVELPDPACASGSRVESQIEQTRHRFVELFGRPIPGVFRRLAHPVKVKVTGVGFFDKLHAQRGVAPNGIELHPVLEIEPAG